MRAIIQRVKNASVKVDGQIISNIGPGLMCLIGIGKEDTKTDSEWLCKKILNLKLFPSADSTKGWDRSVKDMDYEILFVSQFTLFAYTKKGTKPDFHLASPSELSKVHYNEFLEIFKQTYNADKIKDGQFGAMMDVNLTNDGPVTISLDSKL
ncbi:D-tyrosyl-tRNA(Tyr) deacylase [Tieghemostelium lacteum]|uniref:D-aminoacyl-tRNA deacylase n=1 Tax=Tieghemostelium lacteum TaxID=361077 RepID=A0A152A4F9_TIELA|nr:D-tyrosyl-tRNA(Tyr) deacylase [Tieghemostelium lacteum]|eukprot:KYR00967.1 D-tyrosyl-tRNA(Tyr) deacylase [Tieghemostelium lacteum]